MELKQKLFKAAQAREPTTPTATQCLDRAANEREPTPTASRGIPDVGGHGGDGIDEAPTLLHSSHNLSAPVRHPWRGPYSTLRDLFDNGASDLFDNKVKCALEPEVMQAPYYVNSELVRSDIREAQEGVSLNAEVQASDVNTCELVEGPQLNVDESDRHDFDESTCMILDPGSTCIARSVWSDPDTRWTSLDLASLKWLSDGGFSAAS
ncbi:unnamed protein product [Phytophthora lilii]|uniref:Unnamed protein product n=1 Tax=Phytophthora lilii TaxID=2077276 RepID=A0A9W6X5G4_9STRA|nr:unnamed protein product [Phytophthora lilii]